MYWLVQKNHLVWNDHSIFTSDKTIFFWKSLWENIKIYFQKKNGKDSVLKRTSNKIPESSN